LPELSLGFPPRAPGPQIPASGLRRQGDTSGEPVTKFVLKRSLTRAGETSITREINALNVRTF
jgi:hypothetical protein